MTTTAPSITLLPVASSQIHSIGHDPATNTLAIRFRNNKGEPSSLYHYENFTAEEFEEFRAAKSTGSHFTKHIKTFDKKYPFKKIDETEPTASEPTAEE